MKFIEYLNKMSHKQFYAIFGTGCIVAFYLLFTNCYQLYGEHCFYVP